MDEDLKEKFTDFFELVLLIVLDSVLIITVAFFFNLVTTVLEKWIFHASLESLDKKEIIIVYTISKMLIVASFGIYVTYDILKQIIKFTKRLRK